MSNLYVGTHRTTNKKWRDGWDKVFKKSKIITKGNFPWALQSVKGKMIRECPRCDSRKIKRNKCQKCGYVPGDDFWAKGFADKEINKGMENLRDFIKRKKNASNND